MDKPATNPRAPDRCEAAIRVNGDRCTNGGRSRWRVTGQWSGKFITQRDVWLCGTHLRAMPVGFYLWDNNRVEVRRPNSRRIAA